MGRNGPWLLLVFGGSGAGVETSHHPPWRAQLQAGLGVWLGHCTEAPHALPRRVKMALAKKEEAVSSLRKQHQVGPRGGPA